MGNFEVATVTPAQEVAAKLVEELLNPNEQLALFVDYNEAQRTMYNDFTARRLQQANPDKLIVDADKIRESRVQAAYAGAGFAPAEYDNLMFVDNDQEDVGRLVMGLWYKKYRVPKRTAKSNRMRDEVAEELIVNIAPTSHYDLSSGLYVSSREDLQKVLEFDYENLATCRRLKFDLLYERDE